MPQQIIEHHHHEKNGNGSKLNTIVLAVAGFGLSTLLGLVLWQINRVVDKQDDLADSQAQTNQRLTAVETKVDIAIRERRR